MPDLGRPIEDEYDGPTAQEQLNEAHAEIRNLMAQLKEAIAELEIRRASMSRRDEVAANAIARANAQRDKAKERARLAELETRQARAAALRHTIVRDQREELRICHREIKSLRHDLAYARSSLAVALTQHVRVR